MTIETYDDLEQYVGSKNDFIDDLLNQGYSKGRIYAIEEYRKEMHDMIEGNEEFTDWQKYEILQCNELVAEQMKEQKWQQQ